jgi:hypothetical protein
MEEHTGETAGKFWEEYWREERVKMEEIQGEQLASFGRNSGGKSE